MQGMVKCNGFKERVVIIVGARKDPHTAGSEPGQRQQGALAAGQPPTIVPPEGPQPSRMAAPGRGPVCQPGTQPAAHWGGCLGAPRTVGSLLPLQSSARPGGVPSPLRTKFRRRFTPVPVPPPLLGPISSVRRLPKLLVASFAHHVPVTFGKYLAWHLVPAAGWLLRQAGLALRAPAQPPASPSTCSLGPFPRGPTLLTQLLGVCVPCPVGPSSGADRGGPTEHVAFDWGSCAHTAVTALRWVIGRDLKTLRKSRWVCWGSPRGTSEYRIPDLGCGFSSGEKLTWAKGAPQYAPDPGQGERSIPQ